MREKKRERLAEIKRKRKIRERDSDDEREDDEKKKQKQERDKERETQTRLQHALNLDLPAPLWDSLPLAFQKNLWKGQSGTITSSDSSDSSSNTVSEELKQLRKSLGVLVKGNVSLCPSPILSIEDSLLPELFLNFFRLKKIAQPTIVQSQCWPALLMGANLLGIAPTGSGKTLAYALPAIHHISSQLAPKVTSNRVQPAALILVPTRELAIQVQAVFKAFKGLAQINTGILYGGQDKEQQLDLLRSAGSSLKVLVATPGRLIDLLGSRDKPLDLTKVTYQVIDEADRMLSLGFAEQLDAIAKQLRPGRQVVLFSATFPGRLRELSEQWAPDSVIVRCNTMEVKDFQKEKASNNNASVSTENALTVEKIQNDADKPPPASSGETVEATEACLPPSVTNSSVAQPATASTDKFATVTVSPTIKQHIHVCAAHKRPRLLLKFVERIRQQEKVEKKRQADPMIIFCNKIKTLKFVVSFLNRQNIPSVPLHGQLPQQLREENLNKFRSGKVNIIISTDVAARGIHVKRLKYVVNYDFPPNIEQYCHRIGRCGRQGEAGEAYSLLTRSYAAMAADLVDLLKSCDQAREPNLEKLATQFSLGEVDVDGEEDGGDDDGEEEEEVEVEVEEQKEKT